MIVLSVDPSAKASGWARWANGRLVAFGSLPGLVKGEVNGAAMASVISDAQGIGADPAVMVIEEHTYTRGQKPTAQLHRVRGAWEGLASAAGVTVVCVNSQTWQGALGCTGKTEQRKAIAMQIADALIRKCIADPMHCPDGVMDCTLTEDAADAIALGIYFAKRQQIEGAT